MSKPALSCHRTRRGLMLVCLLALLVVTSGVVAADRFDPVRALIQERIEQRGVPSYAVAVAQDGKIVWEEGFGWADRERSIPATPETAYLLASVSKALTAAGLMTLVQDGRVDLDRPINDYLGSAKLVAWVGNAEEATVRSAANHTAGLGAWREVFYGEGEAVLFAPHETTIRRYGHIVHPPGTRYEYSNFGYGLLGKVIAEVSGMSYPDYMRTHVFAPLGMHASSISPEPAPGVRVAALYGLSGERIPAMTFGMHGFGDVMSSAHDLVRFGMFLSGQRMSAQKEVLRPAALREMRRPSTPDGDHYGVGLYPVKTWPGGPTGYGHNGSATGSNTMLTILPEQGLVVVVLANRWRADNEPIRDAIVRAMLPEWPEAVVQAKPAETASDTQGLSADVVLPAEWRGNWAGTLLTHRRNIPVHLKVPDSGAVQLRIDGQRWSPLEKSHYLEGRLVGESAGHVPIIDTERRKHRVSLEFERDEQGRLVGMIKAGVGPDFNDPDSDFPYFVYTLHYRLELESAADDGMLDEHL